MQCAHSLSSNSPLADSLDRYRTAMTCDVVAVCFWKFEQTCKYDKTMKVGVIMGSVSDYDVMSEAVSMLESFGVEFEKTGGQCPPYAGSAV